MRNLFQLHSLRPSESALRALVITNVSNGHGVLRPRLILKRRQASMHDSQRTRPCPIIDGRMEHSSGGPSEATPYNLPHPAGFGAGRRRFEAGRPGPLRPLVRRARTVRSARPRGHRCGPQRSDARLARTHVRPCGSGGGHRHLRVGNGCEMGRGLIALYRAQGQAAGSRESILRTKAAISRKSRPGGPFR